MEIKQIIAHLIDKKRNENPSLRPRDRTLDTSSEKSIKFAGELREVFNKKSPSSGRFIDESEESYPFKNLLIEFLNSDQSNEDFVSFSKRAADILTSKMRIIPASTGGYISFIYYSYNSTNYLIIALVRETAGLNFTQDLDLADVDSLDLANLRYGARIDTGRTIAGDKTCLSFVAKKASDDPSGYFVDFIGCEKYADAAVQTDELRAKINEYSDAKEFSDEIRQLYLDTAHNYCDEKRKNGEPVIVSNLSAALDPDSPQSFSDFALSEDSALSGEFFPNKSRLEKFLKFKYRGKGLTISFDKDKWERKITYNIENDRLEIDGPPRELIAQLDDE